MATTFTNVPGVQINEVRLGPPPIVGVGTSTAAFVGKAPQTARFPMTPRLVTSADQFVALYITGDPTASPAVPDATRSTPLSRAVLGFFANGGTACYVVNVGTDLATDAVSGVKLLEPIDEVAILAAPGHTDASVYQELKDQAERTGDRFALFDPPAKAVVTTGGVTDLTKLTSGGANRPPDSAYAAFYYPQVLVDKLLSGDPDPTSATPDFVTPVGHLAGIYARVDAARGVHKAPANEVIRGVLGLEDVLTDSQQNALNPDGVNVLRKFADGLVVWGARTLLASTASDKSFLYINVRRLVNYIEESLQDGLRWAVFEPNNLALRQQITRAARGFLDGVWRDGALFGATPDEAYYVRFPEMFNRDEDRAQGKLVVEIGLRATYPAEFIIIRIGLLMQSAATA